MTPPISSTELPVFDANSELFRNVGLLKVAETATRQHGDTVAVRVSDSRDLYIVAGADSFQYWRSHQGHFQIELGDIASNDAITRMLLGDQLQDPRWSEIWVQTANRLSAVSGLFDSWLEASLVAATKAFVADAGKADGMVDLRDLCRNWSIRAVCPAIFGQSLPDDDIADGIAKVEGFYFAMSTKDRAETADHEKLPEFLAARGFLDRIIKIALANSRPDDPALIARIAAVIPPEVSEADRINLLRPTIGRMITEKLNIGGLSLLWTLSQIAQDPLLSQDIATESAGLDAFHLTPEQSRLALSTVREGLRLFPELPFIYRITCQDIPFGKYRVPARATVVFAPWLVQRDPRYWDKPTEFQGARFLDLERHKDHYFPFGVGPRIRGRANFILHQLTVAVSAICAHYRSALSPDCPRGNLRPLLRSALIPRGAVAVTFTPRLAAEPAPRSALAAMSPAQDDKLLA